MNPERLELPSLATPKQPLDEQIKVHLHFEMKAQSSLIYQKAKTEGLNRSKLKFRAGRVPCSICWYRLIASREKVQPKTVTSKGK
ncbi:MAG: hypothetical protein HY960_00705 [Ignavibacteriae bacterium]|nr:hypothetical protein [Ignavibacteriota bacterium]